MYTMKFYIWCRLFFRLMVKKNDSWKEEKRTCFHTIWEICLSSQELSRHVTFLCKETRDIIKSSIISMNGVSRKSWTWKVNTKCFFFLMPYLLWYRSQEHWVITKLNFLLTICLPGHYNTTPWNLISIIFFMFKIVKIKFEC